MKFNDRVVVITGASGGIGKAVTSEFANQGAKVVMFDLSKEQMETTADKLQLCKDRYYAIALDIGNEQAVKDAVAETKKHFGKIDVLVNISGISGPSAMIEDYTFADFKRVYEVNVFGTFLTMKYVLPIMKKQGKGAIINIGSVSGMCGYPFESGYGSSKAAIIGLTRNVANENGGNGIRINSISPGWVNTQMMRDIVNSSENVTLGPMGRAGEPQEMANVICFLASDEASYVNGANFLVDGGMTLG